MRTELASPGSRHLMGTRLAGLALLLAMICGACSEPDPSTYVPLTLGKNRVSLEAQTYLVSMTSVCGTGSGLDDEDFTISAQPTVKIDGTPGIMGGLTDHLCQWPLKRLHVKQAGRYTIEIEKLSDKPMVEGESFALYGLQSDSQQGSILLTIVSVLLLLLLFKIGPGLYRRSRRPPWPAKPYAHLPPPPSPPRP